MYKYDDDSVLVYVFMYCMYPYVCTVMCYEQTKNAPLKCLYLYVGVLQYDDEDKDDDDDEQNEIDLN